VKIAYLINSYPYASLTFVRREIHALEKLGHTVARLAIRTPDHEVVDALDKREMELTHHVLNQGKLKLVGAAFAEFLRNPVQFTKAKMAALKMGMRSKRGLMHHIIYLIEACHVKQWLAKNEVDHLHVHFGTNSATVARLVHLLGGHQYSFTIHGPEEWDDQTSLSLEEKMLDAAAVIGISNYTIAQMRRRLPVEQWDKLHLIHCTIEAEGFENPPEIPADSKLLVCTARLSPQKGQFTLLSAAKVLKDRGVDFELAVLGGGEMLEILQKRIDDEGLQDCVKLHGWVAGEVVRDHLERARALVLPSYAEGLPVAIMESLAMKRPVITTYVAGIPELVKKDVNGWLVPPCDVESLADAMQEALSVEPQKLEAMGTDGRARTLAEHTPATEAVKLEEVFEAIVRQKSSTESLDPTKASLSNLASDQQKL